MNKPRLHFNYNVRAGIFLLFAFYLVINKTSGQTHDLIFDRITPADGFNAGICQRIFQDGRGYIWFGTYNGLMKYDGKGFELFNPEPDNENSIGSPIITSITEDKRENLWIGTDYGVSVYERNSKKFYRFTNDPTNKFSIIHNYIRNLYYDKETDVLWIGTTSGLHTLDLKNLDITQPSKAKFTHYLNIPGDENSIDNNLIREITKDKKGRIFIITNGDYLNSFDPLNNNFKRIHLGKEVNSTYKVSAIDKNNILWISTAILFLINLSLTFSGGKVRPSL